jgi:hypothetical protein
MAPRYVRPLVVDEAALVDGARLVGLYHQLERARARLDAYQLEEVFGVGRHGLAQPPARFDEVMHRACLHEMLDELGHCLRRRSRRGRNHLPPRGVDFKREEVVERRHVFDDAQLLLELGFGRVLLRPRHHLTHLLERGLLERFHEAALEAIEEVVFVDRQRMNAKLLERLVHFALRVCGEAHARRETRVSNARSPKLLARALLRARTSL